MANRRHAAEPGGARGGQGRRAPEPTRSQGKEKDCDRGASNLARGRLCERRDLDNRARRLDKIDFARGARRASGSSGALASGVRVNDPGEQITKGIPQRRPSGTARQEEEGALADRHGRARARFGVKGELDPRAPQHRGAVALEPAEPRGLFNLGVSTAA